MINTNIAKFVEFFLIAVAVIGVGALFVMLAMLDELLAEDESAVLVRARLLRNILIALVPLIAAFLIPPLRRRFAGLNSNSGMNGALEPAADKIWLLMVVITFGIFAAVVWRVFASFADINIR